MADNSFSIDVAAIRERARQKMDAGPVTDGYKRSPEEVTTLAGRRIAPAGVPALHPAFDVTPAEYVTAIITERGVARPPYSASLAALLGALRRLVAAQPRPNPTAIPDKVAGVDFDPDLVAENAGILNIRRVYDVAGVEFTHDGELCSFDTFLLKFNLRDPALQRLAAIVRGFTPALKGHAG